MKTTKEMIDVMQAYERGEQIEYKPTGEEDWIKIEHPKWN